MCERAMPTTLVLAVGLAVSALALGADALPDSRLGLRMAPLLLLSRSDVQEDVGLSPQQRADAEQEIARLYAQAAALRGQKGEAAIAARRKIDQAQQEWLTAHLTQPQFNRLVNIDLQWEGPSVLISRPVVRSRLELTPEQTAALRKAVEQRNRERAPGTLDPEADARLARAALAILDKSQQARWREMLGRPFHPRLASAPSNPPR